MSWVLLLIELLPTIIKLVNMILAAIKKVPLAERGEYRQRLFAIGKENVTKVRGGKGYALVSERAKVEGDLEKLHADLKTRLSA